MHMLHATMEDWKSTGGGCFARNKVLPPSNFNYNHKFYFNRSSYLKFFKVRLDCRTNGVVSHGYHDAYGSTYTHM